MFNRNRLFIVLMLCIVISLLVPTLVSLAQDEATPTVDVIEGTATPVAVDPPVVVVDAPVVISPVETALPPDNPRGGLSLNDFVEFLKPIAIIGMLGVLMLFGTSLFFAYQHVPGWARPMLVGGVDAGIDGLKQSAKETPYEWDDHLYDYFDQKWQEWKAGADTKLSQLVAAANNPPPIGGYRNTPMPDSVPPEVRPPENPPTDQAHDQPPAQ